MKTRAPRSTSFGENEGVGANGVAWVKQNDPALYAILLRIYGPPA